MHKLGGDGGFGSTGDFCDVSPLQNSDFVRSQYSPVLFLDAQGASDGRRKYLSSFFPVLREAGRYYIRRRNPSVSIDEEEGFLAGLYALATQESVWSHYRLGQDRILRVMHGDHLHGFGLMQIDDRWHPVDIARGKGTDLMSNIILGLDIYYAGWLQSARAKCVGSSSDYKSRARSAWSLYNGGGAELCRWSNSRTRTNGDNQYLSGYNSRRWATEVRDLKAAAQLDVRCLAEGKRPCAAPRGFMSAEVGE